MFVYIVLSIHQPNNPVLPRIYRVAMSFDTYLFIFVQCAIRRLLVRLFRLNGRFTVDYCRATTRPFVRKFRASLWWVNYSFKAGFAFHRASYAYVARLSST